MLAPLIESVRAGKRTPSSEIQGSSRSTHVMWSNWSRLVIENDISYRRLESEDGNRMKLQLVVPQSLVPEILKLLHNPTSGHLGVTKTVERVRQRFFWSGLCQDVESWCRNCEVCCRRNNPRVNHVHHCLRAKLVILENESQWTSLGRFRNLLMETSTFLWRATTLLVGLKLFRFLIRKP